MLLTSSYRSPARTCQGYASGSFFFTPIDCLTSSPPCTTSDRAGPPIQWVRTRFSYHGGRLAGAQMRKPWWNRLRTVTEATPSSESPSPITFTLTPETLSAAAAVLQALFGGVVQLHNTLMSQEIERLKVTKEERMEEKQFRREAREAQRQAAIATNAKRKAKEQGVAHLDCGVCRGDVNLLPVDVERHYAEGHGARPAIAAADQSAANDS